MPVTYTTGTSAVTLWSSEAVWKGQKVMITGDHHCQHHDLSVMHHYGDGPDGVLLHYCPTGFLWCADCLGQGDEPGPGECQKWGEV